MTHAALKDQHIESLTDLKKRLLGVYASAEQLSRFRSALDFAIAALSAMEGEAVAIETVGFIRENADGDRFIDWTIEGGIHGLDVGAELNITSACVTDSDGHGDVYTAPPPQQAAESSWPRPELGCGCPCEPSGSDGLRCPDASGRLLCQGATQPQQAGGDAPFCWIRFHNGQPDWAEDCLSLEDVLENYDSEDGYSMQPLYLRPTPPQPEAGGGVTELRAEVERLNAIINTPQADDFLRAVSTEAEHQRQRWGNDHDSGKAPADWFWLIGYLAGKALHATMYGLDEKAEHHVITTAAACANWHKAMRGQTNMRPGIDGDAALSPTPASGGEHG